MVLSFEEKRYLALYLELFNRCYNPRDEREYKVTPNRSIPVRHVEMQNIAYLFHALNMTFTYGFNWNWNSPYSPGFQTLINSLDKKEIEVKEFYDSFNKDQNQENYNNYNEQLQELLTKYLYNKGITEISEISLVLEGILKEEQGSLFLADIIYIGKNVLPDFDLPTILKELNARGINPSMEIAREIWKALGILKIRNIEPKEFTRERTLENKFKNGIR